MPQTSLWQMCHPLRAGRGPNLEDLEPSGPLCCPFSRWLPAADIREGLKTLLNFKGGKVLDPPGRKGLASE